MLTFNATIVVHKNCFTGGDVALKHLRSAFQCDGFTGQHDGAIRTATHAQRANTEGVTESQQAVTSDQSDHGVRTLDALVHRTHRFKNIFAFQRSTAGCATNFVRQHIEQYFGVALGVGVTVVVIGQFTAQLLGIGEIAVVHHDNTEGRIHVEGLSLLFAGCIARRGVTHLTQTHITGQSAHIAGAEHVLHHALGLVHEELAFLLGHDAGCILPAVLQQQQGVINQLIHGCGAHHTNDSTHSCVPSVREDCSSPHSPASPPIG